MNLRQVCAELRGIAKFRMVEVGGDVSGLVMVKEPNPLPDPLTWDSVGELRSLAIEKDAGMFVLLLRTLSRQEPQICPVYCVAVATKGQILAAAISVLRPMEVDEAVALVDEWSERT